MSDTPEKPEGYTKEHADYLRDLRESGVTNMWGAGDYLIERFNIDDALATKYLFYWMKTFRK